MRGIIADGGTATLDPSLSVPRPAADEVLIEIRAVGLCRTDLYVVSGDIPAAFPLVPGHELSGVIAETGDEVTQLSEGMRVAVNPLIPCGKCEFCRMACTEDCVATEFLGVDRDGAFSEYVVVPAANVIPIPDEMSWLTATFLEPVAATLAVLKSGIRPTQQGLIYGDNRLARLTLRILRSAGFESVDVCSEAMWQQLPPHHFDFIVETFATTESLAQMVRAVRPRGRIVLKSRQYRPVSLVLRDVLPKEPILQAVHYGSFSEALKLLATGRIRVDDLIGSCFSLGDFQNAFAAARTSEQFKTFLLPREV